jgi:hypothetical protein
MTDQRVAERVKAMIFTAVYEFHGHILLGFLGDLTPQGAMVVGEKPVETDRDLILSIEFHGATEVPGGRLVIPAHVAHCNVDKDTAYYHTGFKFLEASEEDKKTIEALVARYKFSNDLLK